MGLRVNLEMASFRRLAHDRLAFRNGRHNVSPNLLPPDPRLNEMWPLAEDVNTPLGILIGGRPTRCHFIAGIRGIPQVLRWQICRD
jgi:hypothetical protein